MAGRSLRTARSTSGSSGIALMLAKADSRLSARLAGTVPRVRLGVNLQYPLKAMAGITKTVHGLFGNLAIAAGVAAVVSPALVLPGPELSPLRSLSRARKGRQSSSLAGCCSGA